MTASIQTFLTRFVTRGTATFLAVATAMVGLAATPAFAQDAASPAAGNRPVRIGVPAPKVEMGAGGPGDSVNASVADAIAGMLQGPSIEIVPLRARLDALIRAEAVEQRVDFVLFTSVVRKPGKSGSLFSRAVKAAGPAAMLLPGGGAVAGQIKSTAASAAAVLTSTVSGATQTNDEFTLEYRLAGPDAVSSRATKALTRKASRAGEDVLTPLMEEMGNAVLSAISGNGGR